LDKPSYISTTSLVFVPQKASNIEDVVH